MYKKLKVAFAKENITPENVNFITQFNNFFIS